ncbi:DNA methyltransferase [Streptomonospora halophila]|uniref:DNA methyltransferase n=1 Tax=Streptomonospora halophila TaxID=427369 RepID=UPI0031EEF783
MAQRRQRCLTPPVAPAALAMLPELAERLIAEFSEPGQVVADVMCGSGTVTLAAVRAQRRVVALDGEPECLAQTAMHLSYAEEPANRRVLELVQGDARLAASLFTGHRLDLAVVDPPAPGAAVVPGDYPDSNLAGLAGADYTRALTDALAAVAVRMRPGGRLVLLAPALAAGGGVGVEHLVRSGTDAGLDYLQHIIALSGPLVGDTLTPGPAHPAGSAPTAATGRHRPVHRHLLAFVTPAPAAAEGGARR